MNIVTSLICNLIKNTKVNLSSKHSFKTINIVLIFKLDVSILLSFSDINMFFLGDLV